MERDRETNELAELGTVSGDTLGGPLGVIEDAGYEFKTGISDD